MANAEARRQWTMILDQDWEALGYVGLPDGSGQHLGLEGEIHELFDYTIDGRPAPIWRDQTLSQYNAIRGVLEPVFRLATKFLLCPASLDWFYYLIYGPRALTHPLVQHNGADVYEYRRDDTPMETRHAMARAALRRLAMIHTISLGDTGPDEGLMQPSTTYYEHGVNIKDDSSTKSGIRPHITISNWFVQELMDLCMEGRLAELRMLTMGTKMALTWIHEFAHGAAAASSLSILRAFKQEITLRAWAYVNGFQRDPKEANINEDLFEDENSAEPGYSWENFVFGGNVELPNFNSSSPLAVFKWPNFLKGKKDLRRGGWKPSVTEYIVPMQWLLNVNSQTWWDSVVDGDTTALYIKRIIGIRIFRAYTDVPDDWSASQSSEGIWPTDRHRSLGSSDSYRVSRIQPGVKIQDPSRSRANQWVD